MSGLNDSQRRHVAARFGHVDRLLQDVDRLTREDPSPFATERPDVRPDEARLVHGLVTQVRARMLAALDRLGIPRPRPGVSARWSIETNLQFAGIALSELGGDGLAGYGAVDPGAGAEVAALAADLREVLSRGVALLHEGDPGKLRERIARVPGPAGDVLRAIERRSADAGLVEVRALLAAALDRLDDTGFTIGVFGRVGVGKSSLINAVAGGPVLPVGAVPVTAVPLRIRRGESGAVVRFFDGRSESVPLERIPEFATEDGNPDNRRGVRALDVSLPSLPGDLTLLDTPGLGALAASGSAAVAALPRCDLGLVLVQAGAPLGREELSLLSGLAHAGVAHQILVSKADLVPPAELERVREYVRRAVNQAAGSEPGTVTATGIHFVSTVPAGAAWLGEFRDSVITPLVRNHAEAAAIALRARLHRLVAVTAAAEAGRAGALDGAVIELQRRRLAARDAILLAVDRLSADLRPTLDSARAAVVAAWSGGADAEAALARVLGEAPARCLAAVRRAVSNAGDGSEPGPSFVPPVFEPPPPPPGLRPPGGLGASLRRGSRAASVLGDYRVTVGRAFGDYGERLRAWGLKTVDDLMTTADVGRPEAPESLDAELTRLDEMIETIR